MISLPEQGPDLTTSSSLLDVPEHTKSVSPFMSGRFVSEAGMCWDDLTLEQKLAAIAEDELESQSLDLVLDGIHRAAGKRTSDDQEIIILYDGDHTTAYEDAAGALIPRYSFDVEIALAKQTYGDDVIKVGLLTTLSDLQTVKQKYLWRVMDAVADDRLYTSHYGELAHLERLDDIGRQEQQTLVQSIVSPDMIAATNDREWYDKWDDKLAMTAHLAGQVTNAVLVVVDNMPWPELIDRDHPIVTGVSIGDGFLWRYLNDTPSYEN